MKELLSPYIDCGSWKNLELVPLGEGGVPKYELEGRVGEREDMEHVNMTIFEENEGICGKYEEIY
mgnify:CR=1 FL=1